MTSDLWCGVDRFFATALLEPDPALDAVLAASAEAGLPSHQVSPLQGRLLQLLALSRGARSILEIGTLGGYSAVWLARVLPAGGRLVTLELDPRHAEVAAANLASAGVAGCVDLRVGDALESMASLDSAFDLVFVDADKRLAVEHVEAALRLCAPGAVIVVDNVVRGGAVLDRDAPDPAAAGVRRLVAWLGGQPRLRATAVQTVGEKGHDGFLLAVVSG